MPVTEVLAFCEKRWPGQREKRFGEDLVEALTLMGHTVPTHVALELTRLSDGKKLELAEVEVTRENRQAIWAFGKGKARAAAILSHAQVSEDLAELSARLLDQFAYLHLGGFDWRAELASIEKELASGEADRIPTRDLAERLQRFMARFKDGHAGVSSELLRRPGKYPPFLLQDTGAGVVAFLPDRLDFLDSEHPFVLAIDGMRVEEWLQRVTPLIAAGSPQLVRHRALRELRNLELLRRPEEQTTTDLVRVTLSSGGTSKPIEREFPMTSRRPTYGEWPQRPSGVLKGKMGYLRLAEMDDELVAHVHETMQTFRNTRGLIIDVRGNGGGSRSVLIALAGYLIGPKEGPWIGNAAKYVSSERFEPSHLEARYMYRALDKRWTETQRKAIGQFAADFEPEWEPPGTFSDWHYLVLDRVGPRVIHPYPMTRQRRDSAGTAVGFTAVLGRGPPSRQTAPRPPECRGSGSCGSAGCRESYSRKTALRNA